MIPDNEFRDKLDAVVRNTADAGKAQVEALVDCVVSAGCSSESAVAEMLQKRSLSIPLRANACWLVPRMMVAGAGDLLKELMSDPSELIREEAALGVGLVRPPGGDEALLEVLHHDSSKSVRLAVLHALGMLGSPQSVCPLIAIVEDSGEDAEVRANAAESLAHVRECRVVDVLIKALNDESPEVRFAAAYALGQHGDCRALSLLRVVGSHDLAVTAWGSVASSALDAIDAIQSSEGQGRE